MMSLTVSNLTMSLVRAFINLMSLFETIEAHLETLDHLVTLRYRLSFKFIRKEGELDYCIGRLVTLILLGVCLPFAVGLT